MKIGSLELLMTGDVNKFVILNPDIISLKGKAGESISAKMIITPLGKKEFNILKTFVKNGTDISFKLEKVKNGDGTHFELTVQNKRKTPGRYFDMITIKPDLSPVD